jgi:hypothetical protein
MRHRLFKAYILLFIFCFSSLGFSQIETVFSSRDALRLRIEGAWGELLKKRYLSPDLAKQARIPVTVVIVNDDQTETSVSAVVALRGNTSLSPLECSFPKFSLYFSQDNVSGTILSGREQLAIGSHCSFKGGNSALYGRSYDGKSPHREAMVYRLLEVLEIPSFKTRTLLIQYVDHDYLATPSSVMWQQGFALESLKQFSERLGYELLDEELAHQVDLGDESITNIQRLARIVLFNEMIGNNDWKVNYNETPGLRQTWNVFLAKDLNFSNIEVIPNDFDLSSVVTLLEGKVDAPTEILRKLPNSEIAQAKIYFRDKRQILLEELKALKQLDANGYQYFKMKLDQFYASKLRP